METASLTGQWLFFDKAITDIDLKSIVEAGSCHLCSEAQYEQLQYEKHDTTAHYFTLHLQEGKKIVFTDYSYKNLVKKVKSTIIPLQRMAAVYKQSKSHAMYI